MAGDKKSPKTIPVEGELDGGAYYLWNKKQEAMDGEVRASAIEPEDEFATLSIEGVSKQIIEPPYIFARLEQMVQNNNTLGPCIAAMVANIDGTGHVIEPVEKQEGDLPTKSQKRIEEIEEFFAQPWPGISFETLRKRLRDDMERVGQTYIEVLRNAKGEIALLRHVRGKTVRMVKLDKPVKTKKMVRRGGKEVEFTVNIRERRFIQRIGNQKLIWFKEFGTSRDIDVNTGDWAAKGSTISFQKRGNELIVLSADKDYNTPYGVPRWISQTPSILGSREAEEFNFNFFKSGGIPPLMVLVQGGVLAVKTKETVNTMLNSKEASHKGIVIEAMPASGDIGSSGNTVRMTVERFGADRQKDSMFEGYDEKCHVRTRTAFRMPPLFLGRIEDFSFATAFAAYVVAEAQVFKPERDEFDEMVNLLIMPELDPEGEFIFRSLPLNVNDVEKQLKGLELAMKNKDIDRDQLVEAINEITNLNLKPSEEEPEPEIPPGMQVDDKGKPVMNGKVRADGAPPEASGKGVPVQSPAPALSKTDMSGVVALAVELMEAIKDGSFEDPLTYRSYMANIGSLSKNEMEELKNIIAVHQYLGGITDPEHLSQLAGCTIALMGAVEGHEVH